ncbi:MAG: dicarboxylate/amino acid:cation symporter [Proteobacteria bacterium]|nr:dicarboxylate/amino acid:cation symporter [Pseudomonadota bacterium]
MNLTVRILIGMLAGLALGLGAQWIGLDPQGWFASVFIGDFLDAGGQLFVNSLKIMVVPLVFVSLLCGSASLGATGKVGRLGGKTIGLYMVTTAIAVSLAVTVALIVQPGTGVEGLVATVAYEAKPSPSIKDTLIDILPTNPVAAMAEGKMLQVITFALLLGITISRSGKPGARVLSFFEDVNEVMLKLITMLIKLAPYGVFCLMFKLFAELGWAEIKKLMAYFLTVAAVLVMQLTLVYPLILTLIGRLNVFTFFAKIREPMMVAFSSSSSAATLPVTLRTVEFRLGVNNATASFVIPLGATINMDGTAIMQGVATVFIAQFYGIDLTLVDLGTVVLTATLASIGTAAVPGVGLIMLTMVLEQVGLPVEGIALILGVDRLLDMMRTATNVAGDAVIAVTVAKTENGLDQVVFDDPDAGLVFEKENVVDLNRDPTA